MACLRKLAVTSNRRVKTFSSYCSFAYSAWASFRIGMSGSGSASFQRGAPLVKSSQRQSDGRIIRPVFEARRNLQLSSKEVRTCPLDF
jgi:hypothetical protein